MNEYDKCVLLGKAIDNLVNFTEKRIKYCFYNKELIRKVFFNDICKTKTYEEIIFWNLMKMETKSKMKMEY